MSSMDISMAMDIPMGISMDVSMGISMDISRDTSMGIPMDLGILVRLALITAQVTTCQVGFHFRQILSRVEGRRIPT